MNIEVLVVAGCANEGSTLAAVRSALARTGLQADVSTTVIETEDEARNRGFTGSPTVLIDGRDPLADPGAPIGLACRLYRTPEGLNGVPPTAELQAAVRHASAIR